VPDVRARRREFDVLASLLLAFTGSLRVASAAGVALPDDYVVTGRILAPKQESTPAVRHDRVFGRVDWSHGSFGTGGSLPIDWPVGPDGSFRALVPRERHSVVLEFWFELQDDLGSFETGLHVGMPLNEETGEPDSDRVELGVLQFPSSRTIAAGRVVDRAGKGIAGASVTVALDPERATKEDGERATPNPELRQVRARTAAGGSFRIRAPFAVPDCRIQVEADGYFDGSAELPAADPCEVRLVEKARVVGHVEFEKFEGQQKLYAEVHPREGSGRAFDEGAQVGADGAFAIEDLWPATYDLVLRVEARDDAQPEVLAALDGIEVKEGATAADERLAALSFRRRKRSFHVRLEFPDSKQEEEDADFERQVSCGELLGVDAKGRRTVWSAETIDGEATVRPLVDVERIEVRVEGFRTERIEDLSRDATVRLRPGLPVRVVVLPEKLPCLLRSSLTPIGIQPRWYRRDSSIAFDNDVWKGVYRQPTDANPPGVLNIFDGEESADPASPSEKPTPPPRPDFHPGILLFTLGDPGRFDLRVWDQRDNTLIAIPRESAVLDVKDSADVQTFELHLDPDVVRSLRNE
jgi:hypothetical protein